MKNRVVIVFAFLAVLVSGVLAYAYLGDQSTEISVESVLPKDSFMVMALDHSNPSQVEKVDRLFDVLVDTGFFDDFFNTEDSDFRKLYSVLKGNWKVVFGMSGVSDASEAFFAGKFAYANKFEDYMLSFLESGERPLLRERAGSLTYWTIKGGGYYFARYRDIFFAAASKEAMEEAYKRVLSVDGFNKNEDYLKNIASKSLENSGYVYVNSDGVGSELNDVYNLWGPGFASSVSGIGNIYGTVVAEEDGIRMKTLSNLSYDDEEMATKFPNRDYKIKLKSHVPVGSGLIMYLEEPSVRPYVDGVFGLMDEGVEMNSTIEDFAGLDTSEVSSLLGSPFAFSVADVGGYYPAMAVYVDINDDAVKSAQKLVDAFDKYLGGVILDYDALISESETGAGAFKKEMDLINGAGVNKIYIDWSVFPQELLDGYGIPMAFDLSDVNLQLYYGLTGDNVLILALYPDLDKNYGENVVGEQAYFSDAVDDLSKPGFRISYFSPGPIVNIIDRYMGVFELLELASGDDKAKQMSLDGLLQSLKYLVSTSVVEGDVLGAESFVRVGK